MTNKQDLLALAERVEKGETQKALTSTKGIGADIERALPELSRVGVIYALTSVNSTQEES